MSDPEIDEQNYEFHHVADVHDLSEERGLSANVSGHTIGLFRSGGEYFAISDFCPHQGASLSGGYVEQGVVMCPWHAWKFRLHDGAWADSPNSPIRCQSYPVRVQGDQLQVGIPRDKQTP